MINVSVLSEFDINPDFKGVIIKRAHQYTSYTKNSFFLLLCAKKKNEFYSRLVDLIFKRVEGKELYRRENYSMYNGIVYGDKFLCKDETSSISNYKVYIGIDTYGTKTSETTSILEFEIKRIAKELERLGDQYGFNLKNLKFVEQIKS